MQMTLLESISCFQQEVLISIPEYHTRQVFLFAKNLGTNSAGISSSVMNQSWTVVKFCISRVLYCIIVGVGALNVFKMMSQTELLAWSEPDTKFFADNLLGVEDWGKFCCTRLLNLLKAELQYVTTIYFASLYLTIFICIFRRLYRWC